MFSGLPDSSYWVAVQDTIGCTDYQSATVIGHMPLVIDSIQTADIFCTYSPTGTIEVFAQGGVAPYTYSVDGGNTFTSEKTPSDIYSNSHSVSLQGGSSSSSPITITSAPKNNVPGKSSSMFFKSSLFFPLTATLRVLGK